MNEKKSLIEKILVRSGKYSGDELEEKLEEVREDREKRNRDLESKLAFLRPFLRKLWIFTENDLYQYVNKETDKPDWLSFFILKTLLRMFYGRGELEHLVIQQEEPIPNTSIYFVPEIDDEYKRDYIACVVDCNKVKTNCHEQLHKKRNI